MALPAYPPMKSKYCAALTPYELESQRRARRNEQARLRMARYIPSSEYPHFKLNYVISFPSKRAELKLQSPEEQARVAALNKEYQATYREKHRQDLRSGAKKRRTDAYRLRYGTATYNLYVRAQRRRRIANHKHQAPGRESLEEAQYCISDGDVEGDDDQNLADEIDEV
ncbi:hypothetical protein B0H13DRAFT_1894677 [Mycena leptocephala]|nr:hypothetical protein B0H13DRAFT_1894677 [Mycena leptocephala]